MVLLKKTGPVEATEGGLFLTGKSKEKKTEGVVIAAGPGKTHQDTGTYYPMPVSVHDVVVYPKGCGTDLEIDGEKYLLIMDDDVLVRYPGSEDGETDQTIANAAVIRDNVLVEVEQKQKTNAVATGGILLAKSSTSEKRPSVGTVVKVGPGRLATNGEIMPMEVQVDDMIKFRDFAGASVTIDDLEYIVVRMMDIVAKF
uniref:20 kDa chaperonin, chloroplastic n=1 Tax=Craspedostauros australis TaxID=1486917 RepID=A0A7R9ZP34_9STRA